MFEMLPGWAWLLLAWALLSTGLALGMARWFRWLREEE